MSSSLTTQRYDRIGLEFLSAGRHQALVGVDDMVDLTLHSLQLREAILCLK
jgi:hypothetical protein